MTVDPSTQQRTFLTAVEGDTPLYIPPPVLRPVDSTATVNSYTTAQSYVSSRTSSSSSSRTIQGHPSPLPRSPLLPVTARDGEQSHGANTPSHSSNEAQKLLSRKMSHRNGRGTGTTHNEDRAAREPLISRGNASDPDSRRKEESIRHKLRAYEAVLALKQGDMPDTQQLAEWGRHALRSPVLDARNRRLSSRGREFVRDLRAWIEAVVDLGLGKNYDDKIQEFIYHTSHVGVNVPDVGGAAKVGTTATGQDMARLRERLRKTAGLLWSSDEFRSMINDFASTCVTGMVKWC